MTNTETTSPQQPQSPQQIDPVTGIRPYRISIPQADLDDLRERLAPDPVGR